VDDQAFRGLLGNAKQGDQESFGAIWQAFHPALLRVTRGLAGARDADDVASSVWVDVVRSLDDFDGDVDAFRAWLFTLARRRLIDLRRRQTRRPETPLGDAFDRRGGTDVADDAVSREATDAALALVASLPPDQAEVVLLRAVAGLDVATVATIVGKKPGTVRVLAHRGLANLRRTLERAQEIDGESPL
jgi:RNA polymerase sigma-70 factor (ECF subfamily)